MWCLIRFHWGVCHYFISRAIWWASVSCWKTSRLRGEQWVHRQRSVKAPVCVCEGPDGEEEDKIEWDRARDMWGSACCSYIIFPSWFTVLTRRIDTWIVMWKACLSPGSSVFLSVLWGWHTREGFQLLPSRRHCVCAFNHPLRKHFICNTVCLLYLHVSWEGFVDGLADVDHWWWWSSDERTASAAVTAVDTLLSFFLFIHSCRYAQYLCCSLIINVCICDGGLCLCWEHVLFSCQYALYCSPLCACNYNQCFERLWKKRWEGGFSQ